MPKNVTRLGTAAKRVGQTLGKAPADTPIRVTLVLRRNQLPESHPAAAKLKAHYAGPPHRRERLRLADIEAINAPREDDIARVRAFAELHGLKVLEVSEARHDVVLEGSVAAINRAFHVELEHFQHGNGRHLGHRADLQLPEDLHDAVAAVFGLDGTPILRRHAVAGGKGSIGLPVPQIMKYYQFPEGAGEGQRVAILEFGGGYHAQDLKGYFASLPGNDIPKVKDHRIDGCANTPFSPRKTLGEAIAMMNEPGMTGAKLQAAYPGGEFGDICNTLEATMDIEIVGAIAPSTNIDVYFAPDGADGYRRALYAALGLPVYGDQSGGAATVISVSWASAECEWTIDQMNAIDAALADAARMHVNVCAASGDFGSAAYGSEPPCAAVYYPASSRYVLACGGTTIDQTADGGLGGEVAWNHETLGSLTATGGGVSGLWPLPTWQHGAGVPKNALLGRTLWKPAHQPKDFAGRGVPDVAALADVGVGYQVLIGGVLTRGGGTSASAPLWAGLLAVLTARVGHNIGNFQERIYQPAFARGFTDIIKGNNQLGKSAVVSFSAGVGWDACCGLGTPVGKVLLDAIQAEEAQGTRPA